MPQQIIVDENIPELAKYLETRGFKVHRVSEDFLKSAKDSVIASMLLKRSLSGWKVQLSVI